MKFKVNDLIADKHNLYLVLAIHEDTHQYTVKCIRSKHLGEVGLVVDRRVDKVEMLTSLFDINNPPTREVHIGKCTCSYCGLELELDDECFIYDHGIYCSDECVHKSIQFEHHIISLDDLDSGETAIVPLFNITVEELEKVKKEVSEHAVKE